jgi:mono/diheme cytochrome c family protein
MIRTAPIALAALAGLLGTTAGLSAPKAKSGAAQAASSTLIARGNLVFARNCASCHGQGPGDDGSPSLPGTSRLDSRYKGSLPGALEKRTDLTAETLRYFVRHGSGPMPMFRKTEVSDDDIDAIAAFLKSGGKSKVPR